MGWEGVALAATATSRASNRHENILVRHADGRVTHMPVVRMGEAEPNCTWPAGFMPLAMLAGMLAPVSHFFRVFSLSL